MNQTVISPTVIVGDQSLTLEQVIQVARCGATVEITSDQAIMDRMEASHDFILRAVAEGQSIYGVTTAFGGMAHTILSSEEAEELQNNAIYLHKCGAGKPLPKRDVRAAMLLRIHSHLHGASGVRTELIQRLQRFLNAGMTPAVPALGSIGASGDLVPLSYICGAVMGLDEKYTVDHNGEPIGAVTALKRLGLAPSDCTPKKGWRCLMGHRS